MASPKQKLGRGVLGAPSWERHSDRNGVVHLTPVGGSFGDGEGAVAFGRAPIGKTGKLIARVIDDRNKPYANPRPQGPRIIEPFDWKAKDGEEVVLGHGVLFTEDLPGVKGPRLIGVRPLDGCSENWLDSMPVWHSEVELFFREDGGGR